MSDNSFELKHQLMLNDFDIFETHVDFTDKIPDIINDTTSGVLQITKYCYNWIGKKLNMAVCSSVVGLRYGVWSQRLIP